MDIVNQNDRQLIEALRSCSKTAFNAVYDTYWKQLFQYAYKRVRSQDIAKDIVQDTFIAFWNKKDKLELTSSLPAYLFTILRFKLIDYHHACNVRERYALKIIKQTEPLGDNNIEQRLNVNEINGLLTSSINSLPKKMKKVFELSRINGYSIKQISKKLCISEQTVKNQLSTAIKRISLNFTDYLTMVVIYFLLK